MKVQRVIERRIRLTAQELYDALVKVYDLPPSEEVVFDFDDDGPTDDAGDSITVIARDVSLQELP